MEEYTTNLEFYKVYAHEHFSRMVPEGQWGDHALAENYLRKYWLPEKEYLNAWKAAQDKVFNNNIFPDMVFQPGYKWVPMRGGCLFIEEDFTLLQGALLEMGEEFFIVVQHRQDFLEGEPLFRMKFPANISWNELTSGNYISAVLLEMSFNTYYVFGSQGNWGKYSANDHDAPLDIIGFKPSLAPIFNAHFLSTEEERVETLSWLPEAYR